MIRFVRGNPLLFVVLIATILLISCARATLSSIWVSSRGSESIPVVYKESPGPMREIVLTTDTPGLEVPTVREEINEYGRMTIAVSISNESRSQQMAEVKAKFFDYSGKTLQSTSDWESVFIEPNQITQTNITCLQDGAVTFKVIVR